MSTKKHKKPPDCSFAFLSLFPSVFPSRLSSHSICLLTGPSLEVLNWALNCFRSAQIVGLFADDKLGQAVMVSSLQHATLTRSAPGHCSWTCRAFDYKIYGFFVIMCLGSPRCCSWEFSGLVAVTDQPEFHFVAFFIGALNPMLRQAGFLFLALTGLALGLTRLFAILVSMCGRLPILWSTDVVCYFFLEQHLCVLRPHLQMLDPPLDPPLQGCLLFVVMIHV
ncbi:hypothetical protein Cgig2_018723 [Carnegiea gigantea]|uniref:Uncharacterized protein n=1 Tax=Carnegiea gigantea TaxID=171969 RepID=A0A9Q1GPN9_9CARY|nr:hypothetical protein Cgig2_018723 [Carnegiea gigantea]